MGRLLKNLGFVAILLLLTFAAVMSILFADTLLTLPKGLHVLFSLFFSLVPGLLWLYFFWLQDKYEKEPKEYLLGVFALGAFMAYSLSMPLENLFSAGSPLPLGSPFVRLLQAILLIGCIQELTKFLSVRYSIYYSNEFNEPADGIIYAAAAGLGFAAAYNLVYLLSLDSINISVVSIRVVERYLVHAIFAGVMGFFLGQAKFSDKRKDLLMTIGFILAVMLNGTYSYTTSTIQGMQFNPWRTLALSGASVVLIYIILYGLLLKALAQSKFKPNDQ